MSYRTTARMRPPPSLDQARLCRHLASTSLMLATLIATSTSHAVTYRLTAADRSEISALLRGFFEATRDGDAATLRRLVLSREEFRRVYTPGADPLIVRHQQHIERDLRELRERFAGGAWVGLDAESTRAASFELTPCGRFANPASQCANGPVIEWRAGGSIQRLRIDRLVRLDGHWRLFDPRL